MILCWFTCFVQVVNMKLFLIWFVELVEQFQLPNLYKTRKSTKNWSSNFGLIEEIMDLSCILLAVPLKIVTTLKPKNCFVAGSPAICDRTILAGWYRFDSPAGNLIPTECPGENYCGTRKPVWLNGRHCSLYIFS